MNSGLLGFSPVRRKGSIPIWHGSEWKDVRFVGAHVYVATDPGTFASGSSVALTWDTVRFDSHHFWDPRDPTRLTIPGGLGGYYLMGAQAMWSAGTANHNRFTIGLNGGTGGSGSDLSRHAQRNNNGLVGGHPVAHWLIADGDYLEVFVYQDSGSARSLTFSRASGSTFPAFWIRRVGLDASPNPRQGA